MPTGDRRLGEWFANHSTTAVLVDADDTLWYDRRYFRALEDSFRREAVEAGADATQISALVACAIKGRGPGERGFAHAIRSAALILRPDAREAIARAMVQFAAHPIELLPDVGEALHALRPWRRILLTKGIDAEQRGKLVRSGLAPHFDQVVVLPRKSTAEFRAALHRLGLMPDGAIVIGNSLQDDVLPAVANGLRVVWMNHGESGRDASRFRSHAVCEVSGWRRVIDALRDLAADREQLRHVRQQSAPAAPI